MPVLNRLGKQIRDIFEHGSFNHDLLRKKLETIRLPIRLRRTSYQILKNFSDTLSDPLHYECVLDLYDQFLALQKFLVEDVPVSYDVCQSLFESPTYANGIGFFDEHFNHHLSEYCAALNNAFSHRVHRNTKEEFQDVAIDFRGGLSQLVQGSNAALTCSVGLLKRCFDRDFFAENQDWKDSDKSLQVRVGEKFYRFDKKQSPIDYSRLQQRAFAHRWTIYESQSGFSVALSDDDSNSLLESESFESREEAENLLTAVGARRRNVFVGVAQKFSLQQHWKLKRLNPIAVDSRVTDSSVLAIVDFSFGHVVNPLEYIDFIHEAGHLILENWDNKNSRGYYELATEFDNIARQSISKSESQNPDHNPILDRLMTAPLLQEYDIPADASNVPASQESIENPITKSDYKIQVEQVAQKYLNTERTDLIDDFFQIREELFSDLLTLFFVFNGNAQHFAVFQLAKFNSYQPDKSKNPWAERLSDYLDFAFRIFCVSRTGELLNSLMQKDLQTEEFEEGDSDEQTANSIPWFEVAENIDEEIWNDWFLVPERGSRVLETDFGDSFLTFLEKYSRIDSWCKDLSKWEKLIEDLEFDLEKRALASRISLENCLLKVANLYADHTGYRFPWFDHDGKPIFSDIVDKLACQFEKGEIGWSQTFGSFESHDEPPDLLGVVCASLYAFVRLQMGEFMGLDSDDELHLYRSMDDGTAQFPSGREYASFLIEPLRSRLFSCDPIARANRCKWEICVYRTLDEVSGRLKAKRLNKIMLEPHRDGIDGKILKALKAKSFQALDKNELKIGLVLRSGTDPYFSLLRDKALSRVKTVNAIYGLNLVLVSKFCEFDRAQVEAIVELIDEGITGILIASYPSDETTNAIKQAENSIAVVELTTPSSFKTMSELDGYLKKFEN